MKNRMSAYLAFALICMQLLLMVVSWLMSVLVDGTFNSLLTTDGLRFIFGNMCHAVAQPPLVWLLFVGCAYGIIRKCGIIGDLSRDDEKGYHVRLGLSFMVLVVMIYIIGVVFLAFTTQAPLRSATGVLFPSSFSKALVPILAIGVSLATATYGIVTARFKSLMDFFSSLTFGLQAISPLVVMYIPLSILVMSMGYVHC